MSLLVCLWTTCERALSLRLEIGRRQLRGWYVSTNPFHTSNHGSLGLGLGRGAPELEVPNSLAISGVCLFFSCAMQEGAVLR